MPDYQLTNNKAEGEQLLLSRRELVLMLIAGLLSLPAGLQGLIALFRYISVPSRSFTGAVAPNWVPAGLVKDLTIEQPKVINFGESIVYVMKAKEGKIKAFSGTCPHAGCLVSYDADKTKFVCPCHGGEFDLNGKRVAGPPPTGLFEHKVKISLGRVIVGRRKDV